MNRTIRATRSTAVTAVVIGSVLLVAAAVLAETTPETTDEGEAAFRRGDYAAALKIWQPLADQGDARAQFNLGTMYEGGHGVKRSAAEAVTWYRRAADRGEPHAQYNLAAMYDDGQGVKQDRVQALKWLTIAASRFESGPDREQALRGCREVGANLTAEQKAEAERLAKEWQPQ